MTASHDLHHGHGHGHGALLPRLLELDAEVHTGLLDEALARTAASTGAPDRVRRVLDVGAGVGTGTVALAHRFPAAEIIALDTDEQMLERVRARAGAAGIADRVRTLRADVAGPSLPVGDVDVVWAAAALHEVPDPDRALRNIADALSPGGRLAVLEMDAPPLLLPASFATWEQGLRATGAVATPAPPDLAVSLRTAGFDQVTTARLHSDQVLPASGPAGEYAELELCRIGHVVLPALAGPDRSRLTALAGGGVREVGDLWIRGSRTLFSARRP